MVAGSVSPAAGSVLGRPAHRGGTAAEPGQQRRPAARRPRRVVGVVSKRRVLGARSWALAVPINYVAELAAGGVGVAESRLAGRASRDATREAATRTRSASRSALRQPMLLGAHYLPVSTGPGAATRQLLVFVVAAPAGVGSGLSELTVRLTCGDTRRCRPGCRRGCQSTSRSSARCGLT